jgi:hypothetical protein
MHDDEQFERLAERIERRLGDVERRLTEEVGKLRLEQSEEFGKLRLELSEMRVRTTEEFGQARRETADLRAEMIDRNFHLLKWLLGFFAAQTAALAALLALFR